MLSLGLVAVSGATAVVLPSLGGYLVDGAEPRRCASLGEGVCELALLPPRLLARCKRQGAPLREGEKRTQGQGIGVVLRVVRVLCVCVQQETRALAFSNSLMASLICATMNESRSE